MRREFLRRRFLKAMTFGPRPWLTISAATLAPARVFQEIVERVSKETNGGLQLKYHLGGSLTIKGTDITTAVGDNVIQINAAKAALAAGKLAAASKGKTIAQLDAKAVASAALKGRGNVKLGQKLFTQQGCVACHAVDLAADPFDLAGSIELVRVFTGYAGWGGGQLESELERDAWFVVDGHADDAARRGALHRQGGAARLAEQQGVLEREHVQRRPACAGRVADGTGR